MRSDDKATLYGTILYQNYHELVERVRSLMDTMKERDQQHVYLQSADLDRMISYFQTCSDLIATVDDVLRETPKADAGASSASETKKAPDWVAELLAEPVDDDKAN